MLRKEQMPALRPGSEILSEIRKTDAQSKGVGGVKTPHEELLQDLIFYILH